VYKYAFALTAKIESGWTSCIQVQKVFDFYLLDIYPRLLPALLTFQGERICKVIV
jgi:hypothetical protein